MGRPSLDSSGFAAWLVAGLLEFKVLRVDRGAWPCLKMVLNAKDK